MTLEIGHSEPLNADHDTSAFTCGRSDELDHWLRGALRGPVASSTASVWVVPAKDTNTVLGFFSLTNHRIQPTDLANADLNGSSPAELPATLLGKMALHREHHGTGLGAVLMHEMFATASVGQRYSASKFIVLKAGHGNLVPYYEKYGFRRFRSDPVGLDMYLKMSRATKAAEAVGFLPR